MNYQERRQLQSRQTERQILETALTLMREQGYDKISVRDICAQSGITTGAFYHHFPSKEAMVLSGIGALDSYIKDTLSSRPEKEPPLDRLRSILEAYIDFMEKESGELTGQYYLIRISNSQCGSRLDPDRYIERVMVECFQQAKELGLVQDTFSPQWAASFCYRYFRGLVLDWVLSGYSYSLRERTHEDFKALQRLIAPELSLSDAPPG